MRGLGLESLLYILHSTFYMFSIFDSFPESQYTRSCVTVYELNDENLDSENLRL